MPFFSKSETCGTCKDSEILFETVSRSGFVSTIVRTSSLKSVRICSALYASRKNLRSTQILILSASRRIKNTLITPSAIKIIFCGRFVVVSLANENAVKTTAMLKRICNIKTPFFASAYCKPCRTTTLTFIARWTTIT